MTRSNNAVRIVQRNVVCCFVLLLSISGFARTATAGELPLVNGASFDGSVITWEALDTAIGYNIYLDYRYIDTVSDGTAYVPDRVGSYRIAGFDGNGNFSPLLMPVTNIVIVETIDTALEPPQGVYGTVYSSSAGEIYWDQVSSRTLEYMVSLNGVELGSTNGNSFWMTALLANTENLVTVTARSSNGSVSDSVALSFDTRAAAFPVPATETDISLPEGEVAAPQNARLEIYSAQTAELIWDRAPLSEEISITEIYRDNELIGTSPGNSFYDDTRAPNTLYSYALIAINANGDRSAATFVDPGPFDSSDENIALSLLTGISEAANANPHVKWYPVIQAFNAGDIPDGVIEVSSESTVEGGLTLTRTEYSCDDGAGSLVTERTVGDATTTLLRFDICGNDTVAFYGEVEIVSEGGLLESVDYYDLEVYENDLLFMDGNVTSVRAADASARSITYNDFDYYIDSILIDGTYAETSVVLNQTIAYDAEQSSAPSTFTTDMIVNAHWTQRRTLTVTTDETFVATESSGGNYIVGSFTAESANGELFSLSADTGDSETWFAEISTDSGTRGISGRWSLLLQLPCIVLNEECS